MTDQMCAFTCAAFRFNAVSLFGPFVYLRKVSVKIFQGAKLADENENSSGYCDFALESMCVVVFKILSCFGLWHVCCIKNTRRIVDGFIECLQVRV